MRVIRGHRPMLQRVGKVGLIRRGGIKQEGPPVMIGSPSIPVLAVVDTTITCDPGTWTGEQPITFTYQWYADGVEIVGATSQTYTVQAADVGKVLRCDVTADNAAGTTGPEASNNSDVVVAGWITVDAQPWETVDGQSWETV